MKNSNSKIKSYIRNTTIIVLITSLILANICLITIFYNRTFKYYLPKKPFSEAEFTFTEEVYQSKSYMIEISDAQNLVENFFQNKFNLSKNSYKIIFVDQCNVKSALGQTFILTNTIQIKKDDTYLAGWNLLFTLSHEMTHLVYRTINERFVQFQTFKLLFESGIQELEDKAKYYAIYACSTPDSDNYECSYYIKKYLKSKNLVKEI